MTSLCARCLAVVAAPLLLGLGLGLLPSGAVVSSRNVSVMVAVPLPEAAVLAAGTDDGVPVAVSRRGGSGV